MPDALNALRESVIGILWIVAVIGIALIVAAAANVS